MQILNGALCLLLALFAAVQYNDPDGLFWAAAYGLPALWCGLAAASPTGLRRPLPRALFGLTSLAALAALVWFWPNVPGWWRREVWWGTEAAREGIGLMIAVVALLAPATIAARRV